MYPQCSSRGGDRSKGQFIAIPAHNSQDQKPSGIGNTHVQTMGICYLSHNICYCVGWVAKTV